MVAKHRCQQTFCSSRSLSSRRVVTCSELPESTNARWKRFLTWSYIFQWVEHSYGTFGFKKRRKHPCAHPLYSCTKERKLWSFMPLGPTRSFAMTVPPELHEDPMWWDANVMSKPAHGCHFAGELLIFSCFLVLWCLGPLDPLSFGTSFLWSSVLLPVHVPNKST